MCPHTQRPYCLSIQPILYSFCMNNQLFQIQVNVHRIWNLFLASRRVTSISARHSEGVTGKVTLEKGWCSVRTDRTYFKTSCQLFSSARLLFLDQSRTAEVLRLILYCLFWLSAFMSTGCKLRRYTIPSFFCFKPHMRKGLSVTSRFTKEKFPIPR